jgi:predicted pyridoxine 5'-phosphate oxidase superfamily flavin-nucleotide-binding protein
MTDSVSPDHLVTSTEALKRLYGEPFGPSLVKESDRITIPYRAFIEAAPFFALASGGPEGFDCSPRGDAPGFVRVADEKTLLIPDRRGNNRVDTLRNIIHDPRVALLFLIPGCGETIRVNGRATISTDPALTQSFVIEGKAPRTVMRQGDRALETMGRVPPRRAQEPAERRHDPGRSHPGQDGRSGARPHRSRAVEGDVVLITADRHARA